MCILLGRTLGWRLARCSASSCGCCNAAQVVGQLNASTLPELRGVSSGRRRIGSCVSAAASSGCARPSCTLEHRRPGARCAACSFSIFFQAGLRVAALPELTLTVSPCQAGCLRMPVVVSSRQHRPLLPPSAQPPRARTLRAQHVTAHRLRPCGMRRSTCIELRLEIELTLTWRRSNLGKSTESGGLSRRSALSGGVGRGSSRAPHEG